MCRLSKKSIADAKKLYDSGKHAWVEIWLAEDSPANGTPTATVKGMGESDGSRGLSTLQQVPLQGLGSNKAQSNESQLEEDVRRSPGSETQTATSGGGGYTPHPNGANPPAGGPQAEATGLPLGQTTADKMTIERFDRNLYIQQLQVADAEEAIATQDLLEMVLIKDHLSEGIHRLEMEMANALAILGSRVDGAPLSYVVQWRTESKKELKKLKETFKKLEIAIKQADQPKPPPSMPLRRSLDDNSYQPKSSVPPNTPHRPRRNLNNDFARMDQSMGSDIQERDENRASRGRH